MMARTKDGEHHSGREAVDLDSLFPGPKRLGWCRGSAGA